MKWIDNIDRTNEYLHQLERGLGIVFIEKPDCGKTWTINKILEDLNPDPKLQNLFREYLKVGDKDYSELDSNVLSQNIFELENLITFNGEALNKILEKVKEEIKKQEEEKRIFEEEKRVARERAKINKFWKYGDLVETHFSGICPVSYAMHTEPYRFLKECVQSLRDELYNEDPNMAKLRSLADQISEFFQTKD